MGSNNVKGDKTKATHEGGMLPTGGNIGHVEMGEVACTIGERNPKYILRGR
jgi:hypothetical protein